MPSRTALFELATRRNSYVCRSCLTALGLSQPPQRLTRGYARNSKTGRVSSANQAGAETGAPPAAKVSSEGSKHRRNHFERPGGPGTAETASSWPAWDPEADTTPDLPPGKRPKINYFEKDPRTGEVTPIPEIEDDGEAEPDFENIEELGRSMLDKFKLLDATLGKADRLDGYLEKILAKHGPPGAIDAFRAALKSYDEPDETQPQGDFNVEEASDANAQHIMGTLVQAISESKYDDTPELKEAVSAFQDALKSLTDASTAEATAAKEATAKETTFQEAIDDSFDEVPEPNLFRRRVVQDYNELPLITFSEANLSARTLQRLNYLAGLLNNRLKASVAAIGKSNQVRRARDDATALAFRQMFDAIDPPHAQVHESVWQALWTIFSHKGPSNPHRAKRTRQLSRAMLEAGATMSNRQQLLGIEALFEGGAVDGALDWWKKIVMLLGHQDSRATIAYWELGVRMWCAIGDLERGERACKSLLERSTPSNPADSRVLLHLIQAYCAKPETAEKGFLLYRRMRDLATELGKPLEIQDYDDVVSLFLLTGHTDYAMFVFTDMMFAGTINLHGEAKLPSRVRNQFFFGQWLKRLIGAGDLDGAYNVLLFMQKNGVMAASIQVNGLIGAWLRTGTVINRNKAYNLAWAMIRSRQTFVDLRKREALVEWPIRLWNNRPSNTSPRNGDPEMDYGMVPKATVETFIILASQYRERALFLRLEELFVAYKQCEMPGDSMMMNELIAAQVAQGSSDKAWELYTLMVHEYDILPSADTFAILFSSLPANMIPVPLVNSRKRAESRRQARNIFADMMRSTWVYQDNLGKRNPRNSLSQDQVKLILHSFRKVDDWAGLSAALMGLRDVMGYQLTRGIMLEMIEGMEKIDKPSLRTERSIVRATLRLQHLVETMQQRGDLDAHLTTEGMKDWKVLYKILLSFYWTKLQESVQEGPGPEKLLQEAKEDMGLAEITATMPTDVD